MQFLSCSSHISTAHVWTVAILRRSAYKNMSINAEIALNKQLDGNNEDHIFTPRENINFKMVYHLRCFQMHIAQNLTQTVLNNKDWTLTGASQKVV